MQHFCLRFVSLGGAATCVGLDQYAAAQGKYAAGNITFGSIPPKLKGSVWKSECESFLFPEKNRNRLLKVNNMNVSLTD